MLIVQIMQTRSFVCRQLRPTRTCRPLADWRNSAIVLVAVNEQRWSVLDVSPSWKTTLSRELYASGGGLLVAFINVPYLFKDGLIMHNAEYLENDTITQHAQRKIYCCRQTVYVTTVFIGLHVGLLQWQWHEWPDGNPTEP